MEVAAVVARNRGHAHLVLDVARVRQVCAHDLRGAGERLLGRSQLPPPHGPPGGLPVLQLLELQAGALPAEVDELQPLPGLGVAEVREHRVVAAACGPWLGDGVVLPVDMRLGHLRTVGCEVRAWTGRDVPGWRHPPGSRRFDHPLSASGTDCASE